MNKMFENHEHTIIINLLEYATNEKDMSPETDVLTFLYSIRDSLSEGLERRRRDAINVIHGGTSNYSRVFDTIKHPLTFYDLKIKKETLDTINSMIEEVLDETDTTQYAIVWDIEGYDINNPRFVKISDDKLNIYEILFTPKDKFYTNPTLAEALSLIVNGEKIIFINDPNKNPFDMTWSLHDIFDGKSLSEKEIKNNIKKLFILEADPYLNEVRDAIKEFNETIHQCKECGKYFSLTWSEKLFFEQKGLSIPKRCMPCRRKRKKAKSGDNI
jgi:hypothetical protein